MKKLALLVFVIVTLSACSTDAVDDSDLVGNWQLVQILADPGDGSGSFRSVESEKIIEFRADGTVTTNTSLCEPNSTEIISSGSYDVENHTIFTDCENPTVQQIDFEFQGRYLVLHFISNEGYSQRYQKLN